MFALITAVANKNSNICVSSCVKICFVITNCLFRNVYNSGVNNPALLHAVSAQKETCFIPCDIPFNLPVPKKHVF